MKGAGFYQKISRILCGFGFFTITKFARCPQFFLFYFVKISTFFVTEVFFSNPALDSKRKHNLFSELKHCSRAAKLFKIAQGNFFHHVRPLFKMFFIEKSKIAIHCTSWDTVEQTFLGKKGKTIIFAPECIPSHGTCFSGTITGWGIIM